MNKIKNILMLTALFLGATKISCGKDKFKKKKEAIVNKFLGGGINPKDIEDGDYKVAIYEIYAELENINFENDGWTPKNKIEFGEHELKAGKKIGATLAIKDIIELCKIKSKIDKNGYLPSGKKKWAITGLFIVVSGLLGVYAGSFFGETQQKDLNKNRILEDY